MARVMAQQGHTELANRAYNEAVQAAIAKGGDAVRAKCEELARLVGLPLDLLVYRADSLNAEQAVCIDDKNPYFQMIHGTWGQRLREVFEGIDDPRWDGGDAAHPLMVSLQAELADGSIYQRDPGLAQQLFKRDTEIDDVLLAAMERWEILSAR